MKIKLTKRGERVKDFFTGLLIALVLALAVFYDALANAIITGS